MVISLAAAGLTLGTDAYQITLFGSGSPVLTNPQGVALDGENTVGGTSTGAQLRAPLGQRLPRRQLLRLVHHQHHAAVGLGRLAQDSIRSAIPTSSATTSPSSTTPTFDGTVSEPNPQLVPVAGQTAILDIGIAVLVNGVLTTFFDPTQLPGSLANLAQFIRPNAGTGISDERAEPSRSRWESTEPIPGS